MDGMEDLIEILNLAKAGDLPNQIDQESNISANLTKQLIEEGYLTAIDTTSLEGFSCLQPKITISGREFLNKLIKEKPMNNKILLFISHSSKDTEFVQLLLDLLSSSLNLSTKEIRCTSIDGYRLKAGAQTEQSLKNEVTESEAFIGVISKNSISSMYVAFELGARWGLNLSLIPLLTPGTSFSEIHAPLNYLNILDATKKYQLTQLVDDLAGILDIDPEPLVIYDHKITNILMFKPQPSQDPQIENTNITKNLLLTDKQTTILILISESQSGFLLKDNIIQNLQEKPTKVEYYLDQLNEKHMLSRIFSINDPTRYHLSSEGKAYLVENDLI